MLRTLQVAEAGMRVQQARLEVLSNNLANADTPGFRRLVATFDAQQVGASAVPGADPPQGEGYGNLDMVGARTGLDLRSGPISATGNPLDVALPQDSYLAVRANGGERYTRNGALGLSVEGKLVNSVGQPVVGEGGEISVPPGALEISSDGSILVDGQTIDRLKLVRIEGELTPEGGNLLALAQGARAQALEAGEARLLAGHLEGSNTNPVRELVALIHAHRLFESGQRVLSTTDDTLGRTVNDLGRIR